MAVYNNGKLVKLEVGCIYENNISYKVQIVRKDDHG